MEGCRGRVTILWSLQWRVNIIGRLQWEGKYSLEAALFKTFTIEHKVQFVYLGKRTRAAHKVNILHVYFRVIFSFAALL